MVFEQPDFMFIKTAFPLYHEYMVPCFFCSIDLRICDVRYVTCSSGKHCIYIRIKSITNDMF